LQAYVPHALKKIEKERGPVEEEEREDSPDQKWVVCGNEGMPLTLLK
jgi:hypothetical protein